MKLIAKIFAGAALPFLFASCIFVNASELGETGKDRYQIIPASAKPNSELSAGTEAAATSAGPALVFRIDTTTGQMWYGSWDEKEKRYFFTPIEGSIDENFYEMTLSAEKE